VVYVDKLFVWPSKEKQAHRVGARHGHQWCHLWADDLDELLKFADSIGLKREWLQQKPNGRNAHFDLVPSKRTQALEAGASEMSFGEWYKKRMTDGKTGPA
jgi:hypothetical protein